MAKTQRAADVPQPDQRPPDASPVADTDIAPVGHLSQPPPAEMPAEPPPAEVTDEPLVAFRSRMVAYGMSAAASDAMWAGLSEDRRGRIARCMVDRTMRDVIGGVLMEHADELAAGKTTDAATDAAQGEE